jgi:hypothetical protein
MVRRDLIPNGTPDHLEELALFMVELVSTKDITVLAVTADLNMHHLHFAEPGIRTLEVAAVVVVVVVTRSSDPMEVAIKLVFQEVSVVLVIIVVAAGAAAAARVVTGMSETEGAHRYISYSSAGTAPV